MRWACAFFRAGVVVQVAGGVRAAGAGVAGAAATAAVAVLATIPLVFVLMEVPALIAGAPLHDVLTVYLDQTGSYKKADPRRRESVPARPRSTATPPGWRTRDSRGRCDRGGLPRGRCGRQPVTPASILAVATAAR